MASLARIEVRNDWPNPSYSSGTDIPNNPRSPDFFSSDGNNPSVCSSSALKLGATSVSTKSSQVWKDLPDQKDMVITSNGRPVAILSSINENNLEQVLSAFRQARAMEAVSSIQYESVGRGTDKISLKEIDSEIKSVRSRRKK